MRSQEAHEKSLPLVLVPAANLATEVTEFFSVNSVHNGSVSGTEHHLRRLVTVRDKHFLSFSLYLSPMCGITHNFLGGTSKLG